MKNPFAKSRHDAHPQRKAIIVLPAFNEAPTLAKLLTHIGTAMEEARLNFHVVLIDDGSTDDTAAIASGFSRTMAMTLRRHDVNQGLGATIRDGLVTAIELASDGDIIITMGAGDIWRFGEEFIARLKKAE